MKFRSLIFVLIAIMLVMPMISAVPPVTTEFLGDFRFVIEANIFDYYQTDTSACTHIYVFNQTSGDIADNSIVSCRVELTNSNGTVMLEGMPTTHDDHYKMCRNNTILTERGDYSLAIVCNDSSMYGTKDAFFGLNHYGEGLTPAIEGSHNNSMWALVFFFTLCIIGIFKFQVPVGKFACYFTAHVLFIAGSFAEWQFLHGYALSSVANEGVFKVLFYVSITSLFPIVLLSIVWMAYYHIMNDTITGFMDKGMDFKDAERRAGRNKW